MKWPVVKLDDVALIQMGQSPPGNTYNQNGDGLPFFQGKTDFGYNSPNVRMWCNEPVRIAEKGDVLLSVRAPVGPTNIADRRCCIGRGLSAIRSFDKTILQQDFIRWFFKFIEPMLSLNGYGSTFNAIKVNDIRGIRVPLPTILEQQKIVDLLDQADMLRRKRSEADEKASRIIPALFYKMFGDPVVNLQGFEKKPLKQFGAKVRYGLGQPPKIEEAGVPLIRATNISRGTISKKNLIYVNPEDIPTGKNAILKRDEVIVVRSGAYTGDVAQITEEWEGCIAGYDLIITPSNKLSAEFLEAYLLTPFIQKGYFNNLKARAGQPHLNSNQLEETPVPDVPFRIQVNFSKKVESIRILRKQNEKINRIIQKIFNNLLHQAFTGDLTAKWREAHMKELLEEMEIQAKYLKMEE